ncbi:polyketide cyclase [Clostridiaceae bacterium UIB06]|uniref:Polyketide cyclase n=1 Tax=Clostridium thailandense TaxID=2794346 RepID=A0A949TFJ3_9CLOT|nr:polyketide cyclase [Clostridium thailandense]MBV7271869.1 polyketide cyclase [Clostridium thailandense]MCH5136882.1 polyketide cyclase [Clostridiaceae bacterium UIB06]
MKKSTITATFQADIKKVWEVVTNNNRYEWRSDLSKIDVSADENSFTEYTKDNFSTKFRITLKKPYERYEFDMINKNMNGHWIGVFSSVNNNGTKIEFIEEVSLNNPIMNLFAGLYLKKQQSLYIADLKKELGE